MNFAQQPKLQKFVEDQVKAGRFASPDEVLTEALTRMMSEEEAQLDDETVNAINRADQQFARGQGMDFNRFAAETRQKYSVK